MRRRTRESRSPLRPGSVGRRLTAAGSLGALLLVSCAGGAGGSSARSASPEVLAITQSGNITPTSNFTVSMQLSDSTHVQLVYFTFCQLTQSVCYNPVVMSPRASNWFIGTTDPMTSYPGMTWGIRAGYNITIQFDNNSTVTEPTLPNAFPNLTIASSVSGEFMFAMQVRDQVFGLSGVVTDASTHSAIAGATVTLAPGNNSTVTTSTGAYAFAGLPNGTYQLSIVHPGYNASHLSVAVAGQDAVQNVAIVNSTSPPSKTVGPSSPGPSNGILGNPLALAAIASVVVVVAGAAVLLRARKPRGGAGPSPPTPGT